MALYIRPHCLGAPASRPMPLEFDVEWESEAGLPKGNTRIAQRFNAFQGWDLNRRKEKSRKGRLTAGAPGSEARTQPSLRDFSRFDLDPNVENVGLFSNHPSGMKAKNLVALGVSPASRRLPMSDICRHRRSQVIKRHSPPMGGGISLSPADCPTVIV